MFLDYHGLKLLWGWMIDASSTSISAESVQFKLDLLSTLSSLPVPNKTMLLDSKLLTIVEKWATCCVVVETIVKKDDEDVDKKEPTTPTKTPPSSSTMATTTEASVDQQPEQVDAQLATAVLPDSVIF